MTPLPGTKTVPTGWSRHHTTAAAGGMNAKCRIYNPDDDTTSWDDTTESRTTVRGAPIYDGPCRIQTIMPGRVAAAPQADEVVQFRDYLIQLTFNAPAIAEGWVVEPYEVINDPALNGASMTVASPQEGSERFTRDLLCRHVQR